MGWVMLTPCTQTPTLGSIHTEGPPPRGSGLTAVGLGPSPGISTCSRESSLRRKMGIQQRASVMTMKKKRFAMATSREQTLRGAVLEAVTRME